MVFEEARAACTYLVSKYAISPTQKNLYPLQDVTTKAKIDQKLYFDAGTFYATLQADYVSFFPGLKDFIVPIVILKSAVVHNGSRGPSQELSDKYSEILAWITDMVKSGYVAGTAEMTLADVSLLTTFACLKALGWLDSTRSYPFIEAWARRCKQQIPHYEEVCGHALEALGTRYKQSKAANNRP